MNTFSSMDELKPIFRFLHKHQKVVFVLTTLFFCFLFFVFSFMIKKHLFTQFDFDTTVKMQYRTPLRLDRFFPLFSTLASVQIMSVLLIIFLIFRRKIISGISILFIFFAAHSVELFGKIFINHPPPPFMFFRHNPLGFSFTGDYVQQGNSYPSGHSFRTVFLSILILYILWRSKRCSLLVKVGVSGVIVGIIVLVGASRITLGEHWTTDVIGGILFGIAMGSLGLLFL